MALTDLGDVLPELPQRCSTAEIAAETLRRQISDGKLLPGTKLREEAVSAAFSISRNTVREAFRLLAHEQLVEHALNRGVFVRTVTTDQVRELYRTRRLVQPLGITAALDDAGCLAAMTDRAAVAVAAADRADWDAVGTADIDFHRVMVAGCRSTHIMSMFEQVLAELRLAFLQMPDRRNLHQPYVDGNRRIVDHLTAGDGAGAAAELAAYLDAAEEHVISMLVVPAQHPSL